MASTKHTRSIHIDAAVEDVFHYVEDPAHFVAAMPPDHHASVGAVNRSAEGVVTTYEILYLELGRHRTTVVTRGNVWPTSASLTVHLPAPSTCSPSSLMPPEPR